MAPTVIGRIDAAARVRPNAITADRYTPYQCQAADNLPVVHIVAWSVSDCPNVEPMLELLRDATAGRHDVRIESCVADVSQPMPAGFSGSPTALIDGENRSGAAAISEPACTATLPSLAEVTGWIR